MLAYSGTILVPGYKREDLIQGPQKPVWSVVPHGPDLSWGVSGTCGHGSCPGAEPSWESAFTGID